MKDILTSPRMEDMKRKRRIRHVRLIILFFILFITVIYALSFYSGNPRITINKINVIGTRIINISDVESDTNRILSGKYLRLFTRANSLIYPKNQIYKNLLTDFPRIDKLSVYRVGWNTLKIDISERLGSYLYCGAKIPDIETEIGENCYFINNDGYIFDKAPYFSGNVYFKYYAPLDTDDTNPLSKQMLNAEHFHEVVRFIDGITKLGFKPIYLVITGESNTLYLDHGAQDTSPQIIFNNENNLANILDNLSLSMAKSEFASEIKSKYTTLLYIDLRFNNKVLYKFQ